MYRVIFFFKDWDECDRKNDGYPTEPLTIIDDTPLPNNCHDRSKRSLPHGLGLVVKESGIPGAGLGVWTEKLLPANLRFGPYRGETDFTSKKSGYAWLVT